MTIRRSTFNPITAAIGLLLIVCVGGWSPSMATAETAIPVGDATTVLPPLNAGLNSQQKAGSLAVGDTSIVTKLCLNADPALGVSDTNNCIAAWSSIASAGGSFVAVSTNLLSIGTPPWDVPAQSPSSYTLQTGAADVKAISGQQATAIVRAPDVFFCDTIHTLCQSGNRYGQACSNDSQCPGGGVGSCRVGGICLDPRQPHACNRNSDCGYNATAVFANGGSTGVAGQFNGTLYIQAVNGTPGQICLGLHLGPICYSNWTQLSTAPSYVKRFSPLPKPLTPQGAGSTGRYGAVISGSATFGTAVLGDATGLPPSVTCGDGLCNSTENTSSCAVDCGGVTAPTFSPIMHFSSMPPALPQVDLQLQASIQNPTAVTILVVRSSGQAPTFVPTDGVSYNEGAVFGNSTIVKKITTTSGATVNPIPVDTLPSTSGNFFYRTFQANSFPRYSPGSAVFPITPYILTVNSTLPGKVDIAGSVNSINCNGVTANDCRAYYVSGTTETLTVDAIQAGYRISGWAGCSSFTTYECRVTMTSSKSVTVNVEQSNPGGGDGGGGGSCFTDRVTVDTPLGPVAIDRLRAGDAVYSFDEQTGRTVVSRVVGTMVHENETYGTVVFSDGRQIEVTANHPFYNVRTDAWQEIGTMRIGDVVKLRNSDNSLVIAQMLFHGERGTVFNITVANQHNYYVSGVLVHNKLSI